MKESTKETLHRIGEGMNRGAGIGMHIVTPIAAAGGLVAGGMIGMLFGDDSAANIYLTLGSGFCSGVAAGLTVGSVGGALVGGIKAGCDELKQRKKSRILIERPVIDISRSNSC